MANHFTQKGLELRSKQIETQQEKVKAIGQETGEAAGMNCDWHDNFGYEDAKRRFEMESANLQRLREAMSAAQLITVEEQREEIAIGVTAELSVDGESREFTIGAYGESDPANGLISYNTPLAKALLKMQAGESKRINIGGKSVTVEVKDIYPPSYRYHALIENFVNGDGRPL